MLALSGQNVRCNLRDITQRNRSKLVGVAERSGKRTLFTHLLCIKERVLGVEAGTWEISQHKKVERYVEAQRGTYRITTGEWPVAVLASPFAASTSCSRSMNSRRRGCFCGSARSHPAELRKQTLGTPALFVAVMSSCVMSNWRSCQQACCVDICDLEAVS